MNLIDYGEYEMVIAIKDLEEIAAKQIVDNYMQKIVVNAYNPMYDEMNLYAAIDALGGTYVVGDYYFINNEVRQKVEIYKRVY